MTRNTAGITTSLKRGLDILRGYRADDVTLNNNELASRTSLPKSTIARFTHTLTTLGYLERDDRQGGYCLGGRVVELGHRLLASLPICRVAQPLMQQFADEHRVSVALAAGDQSSMVYLVYCSGRSVVTRHMRVGAVAPMAQTAIGRAYLWALPPARRAWHIAQIATEAGAAADELLSSIERSFSELEKDGFYCSYGEWRREIFAVGAPLIMDRDETVLALNCSATYQGLDRAKLHVALGPALTRLGTDIANTMSDLGKTFWDD